MLSNKKKNITLTAQSVVTVTDGDSTKEVAIEGYSCTINSANPEEMTTSKYFINNEAKELYADYRSECRADYREFQNEAFALQDEIFAEVEAAEAE